MSDTGGSDPATSGYDVPWYSDREAFPDDPTMWRGWTVQDYTLAYALGLDNNHEAEAAVIETLSAHDPALLERVRFDSEHGCFFAYTTSEDDIVALAAVIASMVDAVNPDAIPGTITDSPAYLRDWDALLD